MKGKKIVGMFKLYMASLPATTKYIDGDQKIATIFGSDEFTIHRKTKKIKLRDIGEIDCPEIEIDQPQPDWVAMYKDEVGYLSILGNGNPYKNTEDLLPKKDGVIIAIPYSVMY